MPARAAATQVCLMLNSFRRKELGEKKSRGKLGKEEATGGNKRPFLPDLALIC